MGPLGHFFPFGSAHSARHDHAALLPPEEPVALFLTFPLQRLTQPGLIALPPAAELLLPLHAGIIHIAIQRFGERAVDMHPAGVQLAQRLVDGRDQPAGGNILRGTRQRNRLRRMGGEHPRLTNRLIGAAVDQLRRTVGGQENQLFPGETRLNQRRIEVRGGGPGGHNDRHRLATGFRQTERQVAEAAFVKMGMMDKGAVFRRRQG